MEYLDKTGLAYFWGKVKEKINAKASVLDCYPVGAIYMSIDSTSPASLFGGTWEQIEGRFLLGASVDYEAGETGGETDHTLTIDEMPNHAHPTNSVNGDIPPSGAGTDKTYGVTTVARSTWTDAVGGGKPHNNMPPYLVVYMWKRMA